MRFVLAVLTVGLVTGCATESRRDRMADACFKSGYALGTPEFQNCMAQSGADSAGPMGGPVVVPVPVFIRQPPVRPTPMTTNCFRNGPFTNCQTF